MDRRYNFDATWEDSKRVDASARASVFRSRLSHESSPRDMKGRVAPVDVATEPSLPCMVLEECRGNKVLYFQGIQWLLI